MEQKVHDAAIAFLKKSDMDVIDEDYDGFFVAIDEDKTIRFIKLVISQGESEFDTGLEKMSRSEFEKIITKYYIENPDLEIGESGVSKVALDFMNFLVIDDGRAMLRFHKDASI